MKTTTIPGTNLVCSRFIFGTDRLFSVGSRSRRIALLEAAVVLPSGGGANPTMTLLMLACRCARELSAA
jgi:choline dehydrogenase-like flavoprotein